MKKIFTLIAMALVAVGVNAQTYKSDFTDNQVFDATKANIDAAVTAGWMSRAGSEKGNAKPRFNPETEEAITNGTQAEYYKIKAETSRSVTVYVTGVSKIKAFVSNSGSDERKLYAKVNNGSQQELAAATGGQGAIGAVSLEKSENNKVVFYASGDIYLTTLKFVTADDLTPVLSASPKSITLAANPFNTAPTAKFTISGKNLTAGSYPLTVPNVAGLSVAPESFTVGDDGKVSQEFTVTYSSTADVAKADAKITAAVGDMTAEVIVTYSSMAALTELGETSANAEWNFENITETIQLSSETNPSTSDWITYADYSSQMTFPSGFDATKIAFKGQYPVRSKKCQDGVIKIKTTKPGLLSVKFSDTGTSGDSYERYLAINGTRDLVIKGETTTKQVYTKRYTESNVGYNDAKTQANIAVLAGEVTIGALKVDTDAESDTYNQLIHAQVCYYDVKFTVDESITEGTTGIQTLKSAQAANDATIYNLAGQKVGAGFKGIAIQNGKKVVIK